MATKEETKVLQTLSLQLYGDKNRWKTVAKNGVPCIVAVDSGGAPVKQVVKLTEKQMKDFMVRKLENTAARKQYNEKLAQKKKLTRFAITALVLALVGGICYVSL